ncbi:hypothetical protein SPBRAN_1450 [uncultured Candidatus Thioglobus sp.]|nr:hypothetical protein SPBRAN_1450 [uncultured Candidatus Thioglobus sp.]
MILALDFSSSKVRWAEKDEAKIASIFILYKAYLENIKACSQSTQLNILKIQRSRG